MMNNKATLPKTTQSEIKEQLHAAISAIQKKPAGRNWRRLFQKSKAKPWILLIGKHGAGKTSLLAKSQHSFVSPTKKSITEALETKNVDWWIGEDFVFADPAGKFCFSNATETQHYSYWQFFLKSLKKKFTQPFDSICLIVDLPSLVYYQDIAFEDFIKRWQEQIHLLAEVCDPLCINIVVTQCDYLAGYAEFFAHQDKDQQQQPLGFSLIDNQQVTHIHDRFMQQFDTFVSMVNQRTLDRLHYEPNQARRLRIHDFPFQLEHFKKPLSAIIASLPETHSIFVNNIFFCSTEQTTHTINVLSDKLNKAFQFKTTTETPLIAEERALFIHKMISRLAKPHITQKVTSKSTPTKWWHYASYPIAISSVVLLTALFQHSYHKNLESFKTIEINLTKANGQLAWLSELDHLKQAEIALQKSSLRNPYLFGFNHAYKLNQQIKHQYRWLLNHEFIPYLNETLAKKIKHETESNSPELYNSLQVYLMLGKTEQRDNDFIQHWFSALWSSQFSNDQKSQDNLNQYVKDVLQSQQIRWTQNDELIDQAKLILQKQPLAQIAFKMLRNNGGLQSIPLEKNFSIDGIDLTKANISKFYSTDNFANVYNKQIPKLANAIFKGNWVLGTHTKNDESLNQLIQQLRYLYVQHYLSSWQQSMEQITFQMPTHFQQAAQQTNLLTNPDSLLWQIYQEAMTAAINAGAQTTVNLVISENDQPLSDYLPDGGKAAPMQKSLVALHNYLQHMSEAPSSVKASYDESVKRFTAQDAKDPITNALIVAKTLPLPLRDWVTALAKNDWRLMLNNSRDFLNTMWQTNVMSVYNKTILNRFPIYADSTEDITVDNFNQFFGPGGVVQNYFNDYVKPFTDMSQAYWSWKSLDDEKITIPQSSLDMLIRASMIQQMFYTDNHSTPSLKFTLTPADMSPESSQFALNIGGQMIHYMPGIKKSSTLKWPGQDGNFVTMRFDNAAENNPTLTTMGPWAWLRLLNASTIQSSSNPQQFQVTFRLGNTQAIYQMIATNPVNPYLPNVLAGFRFDDKL